MKFTQLKNSIQADGYANIYLLEGEELYFRDKGIEMLKAAVSLPEFNFVSLEGASLKGARAADLVSAVSALPFLSERRMVLVSEFYPTEKEYEAYCKPIFVRPAESTILVIANTGAGKPKAGGCDWKKKPNVVAVDCGRASDEDILRWLYVTFRRAGITAGADCCAAIRDYCVSDMARISRESEKIIAYLPEGGALDRATVDALVYRDTAYKIYELTQAAARKDYTAFVRIMDGMVGKGYDENGFLGALCSHFRTLYEVSAFRGSDRAAAEKFGMKEYAVKKSREQAARFSPEALGAYYADMYAASAKARAGEITFSAALQTVIGKIFFKTYEKRL